MKIRLSRFGFSGIVARDLRILEGHDDYRTVDNDDDGFNKERKKILLVDDEPDITIVFKLALEDAGFIVDTYQDPSAALSKFKPNFYGLVILDIRMLGMSGFELHKELQKIDPQLIFCFITAGEIYYNEVRSREGDKKRRGGTILYNRTRTVFTKADSSNDCRVNGFSKGVTLY